MLQRRGRLEAIQQTKEELAKEEEKLFFFENFDKLEIEKDEKDLAWRRWQLVLCNMCVDHFPLQDVP